ncbi:protein HGH1 homolog isoform X1 [Xenopus laevis]|uniref:Protein HGH1 homolog n=1 Tax=Xenopus laevis TaxID=8355 RepID=A0A8J1KW28_XENLA|nr:protein HGH1 homolog isoform X1 [Xenopus laevis]
MDPALCSELLSFLKPETRADVRAQALEYILGVSGTPEGRQSLCAEPRLLQVVLDLTTEQSAHVAQDAHHVLVNLTSDPTTHKSLLGHVPTLLPSLLTLLQDPTCPFSDSTCTALCNLSREEESCQSFLQTLKQEGLCQLLHMLCTPKYNGHASLDYLGPLVCNLTQLPEGRDFILDRDRCVIQRLLPYVTAGSTVRKGGIVGTLRNCCFNHRDHEWLLSDQVDLLPFLLLPLAGGEEYTDEEMESLPPDLQYLPEDKERESDPDIRKMLIETVQLLCATAGGRRIVRQKGTYLIMRELHSWERESYVSRACEKLIQVLIGDEPEAGLENLMEVTVPPDLEETFTRVDQEDEGSLDQ